jgi:hypothetical protein
MNNIKTFKTLDLHMILKEKIIKWCLTNTYILN